MRVTIHLTSQASVTHRIYDLDDISYLASLMVAGRATTEDTMIVETPRDRYEYPMSSVTRIEIFPKG